jgi:hypothetical protein
MKKKKIAPKKLQPIEGLKPSEIKALQELPDSDYRAFVCGDLKEFPDSEFVTFSDKELKAMTLTLEELKAMIFQNLKINSIGPNEK